MDMDGSIAHQSLTALNSGKSLGTSRREWLWAFAPCPSEPLPHPAIIRMTDTSIIWYVVNYNFRRSFIRKYYCWWNQLISSIACYQYH